jgi:hypothetical protein
MTPRLVTYIQTHFKKYHLNPTLPPNYAVKVFHKIKGPTAGPNPNGGRNDKEVDPAKQHIRR